MEWEKVEPFRGKIHQGCLNCPPVLEVAPMETIVAVGFGVAAITKDGETVYAEGGEDDDWRYLREFEAIAATDPDHDWRLILHAPLRGRTYQRHDTEKWVLIESNEGFA